jgi:hypothetical protein
MDPAAWSGDSHDPDRGSPSNEVFVHVGVRVPEDHRRMRPALALSCVFALAAGLGRASDEGPEAAREAVARGELVRLEALIADALRRHPGTVLEVELDDGEYEIEILRRDGRVAELVYDARTGRLLEVEIEDPEADD